MRAILIAVLAAVLPAQALCAERITLVVGFSAGGTSSSAARVIAEYLEKSSWKTVLVENRPGAGGMLAAAWVRQQKGADTLLFMSATSALKVAPDSGLKPVSVIATYPYVAVVKADAPRTLAEYMAKPQDPSLLNVATAGAGSVPHLLGVKLFEAYGSHMVHVPYSGSAPAIQDVLGGHVSMAIVPYPDFMPFVDRLHVLAKSADGIDLSGWMGVYAPPSADDADIERLSILLKEVTNLAQDKLGKLGFHAVWQPGKLLQEMHVRDHESLMAIARKLGVTP